MRHRRNGIANRSKSHNGEAGGRALSVQTTSAHDSRTITVSVGVRVRVGVRHAVLSVAWDQRGDRGSDGVLDGICAPVVEHVVPDGDCE
jgi:hypothetical protein